MYNSMLIFVVVAVTTPTIVCLFSKIKLKCQSNCHFCLCPMANIPVKLHRSHGS